MHVVFGPPDQQTRQTTKAVEKPDHFRHRCHLYPVGRNRTDAGAHYDSAYNPGEAQVTF